MKDIFQVSLNSYSRGAGNPAQTSSKNYFRNADLGKHNGRVVLCLCVRLFKTGFMFYICEQWWVHVYCGSQLFFHLISAVSTMRLLSRGQRLIILGVGMVHMFSNETKKKQLGINMEPTLRFLSTAKRGRQRGTRPFWLLEKILSPPLQTTPKKLPEV